MTLRDLLERVERATGPDRALDFAIAEFLSYVPVHTVVETGTPYGWFRRSTEFVLWKTKASDPHAGVDLWQPTPVTSSVDAALALIERKFPGCGLALNIGSVKAASMWPLKTQGGGFFDATARTPALALCATLLAAMIEQEGINAADTPTT